MEAMWPRGGEVGKEREALGMRQDGLHVPAFGSAQAGRPEYPQLDHAADLSAASGPLTGAVRDDATALRYCVDESIMASGTVGGNPGSAFSTAWAEELEVPMNGFTRAWLWGTMPASLAAALWGCDGSEPTEPAVRAIFAVAAPSAPSNANAVAVTVDTIRLSWRDNSTTETGFKVLRSTTGPSGTYSLQATRAANVTTYRDATVAPLKSYCYKIRAYRVQDGQTSFSAFSTPVCATTPAPPLPTAPSGTAAKPVSSTALDVSWTDRSSNEAGFRVKRSIDGGSTWPVAGTVGPNITAFRDNGRTAEQQVCYRVYAFNAYGNSTLSNTDCTTPPAAPSGLSAQTAQQGIDLAWIDNSTVEDGYQVQRSGDGVNFTVLADVLASSTTYRDATTTNATHWYRVRAKKDGGFSDFSNVASGGWSCVPTSETEVCDNGLDDNCDGFMDSEDPSCPVACEIQECGFFHCPPGYVCGFDGCCVSHCADGERNADEGDVDCGGSCSTKCGAGQTCGLHHDCASGNCSFGVCQP
jgi:hypothetical protein